MIPRPRHRSVRSELKGQQQPSLFDHGDRGAKLRLVNDVPLPRICRVDRGAVSDKVLRVVLRAIDDAAGKNSSWTIPIDWIADFTGYVEATVRRALEALTSDAVVLALISEGRISEGALKAALGDEGSLQLVSVEHRYGPQGRLPSRMQILWATLKALVDAESTSPSAGARQGARRPAVKLRSGTGHGAPGTGHGDRSGTGHGAPGTGHGDRSLTAPSSAHKDPPPPEASSSWKKVEEGLISSGVANWRSLVADARKRDLSASEILALIEYFRGRPGAWEPGALYRRIGNHATGLAIGDGWPPKSQKFLDAQRRTAELKADEERRRSQQEHARRVEAVRLEREELERVHGPTLDAMDTNARLELANGLRGILPRYVRREIHANRLQVVRYELLRAIDRRARSAALSHNPSSHGNG